MFDFHIVAVLSAAAPEGTSGSWCRYEIANQITRISGLRAGSPEQVRCYVQECVQRLNNRHRSPAAIALN